MNSKRELAEIYASQTGFRPETLEKVLRLANVLGEVNRDSFLSRVLILKGGTALNLFFGNPQRLSVDLDFNYVGSHERGRMLEDRPTVEQALEEIASAQGYRVQRSRQEHAGRKFYLGYEGLRGKAERIEVDLNYLFREPLVPPLLLPMWQPGELERPKARIAGFEELATGKILAFLDRAACRDLYDVLQLPRWDSTALASARFRGILIAFAATLSRPLARYQPAGLQRITEIVIREQLTPMLSREEEIHLDEMKERAWSVVAPFLRMTQGEIEYTDRIWKGDLRPELLFPDDTDIVERLRRHPGLLWKVEKARAKTGKRS